MNPAVRTLEAELYENKKKEEMIFFTCALEMWQMCTCASTPPCTGHLGKSVTNEGGLNWVSAQETKPSSFLITCLTKSNLDRSAEVM